MKIASIIEVTSKRFFFLWLGTLPITLTVKQAELAWKENKDAKYVLWREKRGLKKFLI